jgi:hypothetical protein
MGRKQLFQYWQKGTKKFLQLQATSVPNILSLDEFKESISEFTMSNDPSQLLGPHVLAAQHRNQRTFFAYAYRGIQKKGPCIPKVMNGPLKPSFDPNVGQNDTNTTIVEDILSRYAYALT